MRTTTAAPGRTTTRNRTAAWLAGAAGVALLLGGGGTFALWRDTASIPGNRVATGALSVGAGAGDWTVTALDAADRPVGEAVPLPEGWLLVPGHRVEGTFPVAPELVGDNLTATLSAGPGVAGTHGELEVQLLSGGAVLDAVDGRHVLATDLVPGGPAPADLTVRITFPSGATATTGDRLDLGDLTLTLEQNAPAPLG